MHRPLQTMKFNGPAAMPSSFSVTKNLTKLVSMRRSARTIVSLLMLVFLMTSVSARGINVEGWVHDLSHHGQKHLASLAHELPDPSQATGKSGSQSPDELAHQLFHATSNTYLLAGSDANFSWGIAPQIQVSPAQNVSVPFADIEPPFRPPRLSAEG